MSVVLFIIAFACVVLYLARRAHAFWNKPLPPGPVALPIVGNLLVLLRSEPPWKIMKGLSDKYGNVFSLQLGPQVAIVLCDHVAIRDAFVKQAPCFSGRPYVYSISQFSRNNCGIAFGNISPEWSYHKKLASIAIHTNIHSNNKHDTATSTEEKILEEIAHLVEVLKTKKDTPVDISQDLCLSVINVICHMTFNQRYQLNDPEFQTILRDNRQFIDLLTPGDPVDIFPILKMFPNKRLRLIEELVTRRDELFQKKFRDHLSTFDPNNIRDITDSLLKAMQDCDDNGNTLNEDMILMTMWEIFTGGFQTISETLKWAYAYLISNPEVQENICLEMKRIIGDRPLRWTDKPCLPYLNATILEILRCSSVSSMNAPHCTTHDTTYRGYNIPKDTMVMCNLWWVHHDPKYWKEPFKFEPGRFLNEEGEVIIPQSFLPFSTGRRMCLGEQLAKMQMFLFVGCLVQSFRFQEVPGESYPDLEPESGMFRLVKPYKTVISKR
ncbi:steroid 17-alpha-hydroxylase/17,20 lyase-like [Saccoglossus kowalevskii]